MRLLLVTILAATVAWLAPLAHASPPDPTWEGGVYDGADYDDVILLATSLTGPHELPPLPLVASVPRLIGIVSHPDATGPAAPVLPAPQSRSPYRLRRSADPQHDRMTSRADPARASNGARP